MNVIIIGSGKTGRRLALALDERGYDVAVVDNDEEELKLLGEEFSGITVCGDETDIDVLLGAGCDNADIAFAVTEKDNVNVMVAQTLNVEFGLSDVYLRVLDPSREAVFRRFGLRTVCPTRLESDILFKLATQDSDEIDSVTVGGNSVSFTMKKAERRQVGKTADEIVHREGEMLFAVKKKKRGALILVSDEAFHIDDGDMLVYASI